MCLWPIDCEMVCCCTAVAHLRPTKVIDWFGHVECSHLVCSNAFLSLSLSLSRRLISGSSGHWLERVAKFGTAEVKRKHFPLFFPPSNNRKTHCADLVRPIDFLRWGCLGQIQLLRLLTSPHTGPFFPSGESEDPANLWDSGWAVLNKKRKRQSKDVYIWVPQRSSLLSNWLILFYINFIFVVYSFRKTLYVLILLL